MSQVIEHPQVVHSTAIYSSASPLRHPLRLVREIISDIWNSRELIQILFVRDLKAQYRQSVLGYVWIFAPTIATTLIWTFLSGEKLIQVSATSIPYPAFVLIGSMLWGVFTAGVNQPLASFHAGSAVFMKLRVPPEAFIAAGLAHVIFDLLIRMIVLIPVFVIFHITPPNTIFLFPIAVVCLLIVSFAIGILLLPLGSLYSDVSRVVSMALGMGMYLTPVIFPPATSGFAGTIIKLNPLTSFIVTGRDWLTLGNSSYAPAMFAITFVSAVGLIVGLIIFRVALPHLIVRLGM